jgi:NADPH-dependent curcumin reductase CurA
MNTEFVLTHYEAFQQELGPLVAAGEIKYREDVVDGLENEPKALIGMLKGSNFGKLLVRVS